MKKMTVICLLISASVFGCTLSDVKGCGADEHVALSGNCVEDTIEHCGSETVDCTSMPGWLDGYCDVSSGGCIPEECIVGYHKHGRLCEVDSPEFCGVDSVECRKNQICDQGECTDCPEETEVRNNRCMAIIKADCEFDEDCQERAKCINGKCIECPAGSHHEGEVCVPDVECETWTDCADNEMCVNGDCVPCPEGYHIEAGSCVLDVTVECSDWHDCEENSMCAGGKCFKCPEGQHLDNGVCVADQVIECNDWHDCQEREVCINNTCIACLEGQHVEGGVCTADVIHECSQASDCPTGSICIESFCMACGLDKHVSGEACENDTAQNCGAVGVNCQAENKVCRQSSCIACPIGQHADNNECVDDDAWNCGAKGTTCQDRSCDGRPCEICSGGQCRLCPVGEHVDNGQCVSDAVSACGPSLFDCTASTGWAGGNCVNGSCEAASCATGYCVDGHVCVVGDTEQRCGTNGKECQVCPSGRICKNGTCALPECANGVCRYQEKCENTNSHCGNSCADCTKMSNAVSGLCTSNGVCSATECKPDYHLSTTSQRSTCVADSANICGKAEVKCASGQWCFAGACTSLMVSGKPSEVRCGSPANKYTFGVYLSGDPGKTVTVKLKLTDEAGNVLTGKTNGISFSPSTLTFNSSNYAAKQNVTITSSNASFVPDQNLYANAKLYLDMSATGGYKPLSTWIVFDYYAYCDRSFGFTGGVQTASLPKGKYKLTVLGAGGGSGKNLGGAGGKAYGTLTLTSKTDVKVYVGGKGTQCQDSSCGGYNGGSPGSSGSCLINCYGYGGGGATDIRIGSTALGKRVIVAGGGGGGYSGLSYNSKGGSGGGATGGNGENEGTHATGTPGGGSNGCSNGNTSMCKFGVANAAPSDTKSYKGGGGGGWFGGATAQAQKTTGGGGSGFTFTGVTTEYTKAGGTLTDTYKLTSVSKTSGGGAAADTNGSATITVVK